MLLRFVACVSATFIATNALAQQAPSPSEPSDAARALVGAWELSNPDRDRRCTLTFRLDAAPQGFAVTLGPSCAAAFPDMRPTAAWTMGSDDAHGPGGEQSQY